MKNTSELLRLIISFIICSTVIFYDGYTLSGIKATISEKSTTAPVKSTETHTETTADNTQKTEPAQDENKAENTAAVTASAAAAKGKIINKFITPYTANTAYNNVYLKNSTDLSIDIKSLLEEPLGFKIEKSDAPQVLIVHTHATECFMNEERDYYTDADATRSADNSLNTVALGDIITNKLNSAGIKTLHSDVQHDNPSYTDAYPNASKTIRGYLKDYPSIKVVIDLHRDSVSSGESDKVKLTTKIGGKTAAQVMLVMGSQSGGVTNFPNWRENLKLAVRLQQTFEVMYPTLARSIMFMPRNYNESLTTGSMLLEVGTEANTLEEVKYSAELVANALLSLLNTQT